MILGRRGRLIKIATLQIANILIKYPDLLNMFRLQGWLKYFKLGRPRKHMFMADWLIKHLRRHQQNNNTKIKGRQIH